MKTERERYVGRIEPREIVHAERRVRERREHGYVQWYDALPHCRVRRRSDIDTG